MLNVLALQELPDDSEQFPQTGCGTSGFTSTCSTGFGGGTCACIE
jgi:hypothetical protein